MTTTAKIFDIERGSYVDGPGIRTTVFFKGCNLRCAWCHNPESQLCATQRMFFKNKCTACGTCKKICPSKTACTLCGKCEDYCPQSAIRICGKEMTPEEVLAQIMHDAEFYKTSGGGVTFSGGECMLQLPSLLEMLCLCRENGIHTAIDTAGDVPYDSFARVIPYTNLFLFDLKCMDDAKHRAYTGVGNARILSNLKALLAVRAHVWVRIPIIMGVNDSDEEMEAVRRFLQNYGQPEKIELLPYHKMGEHKYRALGMEAKIFNPPTPQRLSELYAILNA